MDGHLTYSGRAHRQARIGILAWLRQALRHPGALTILRIGFLAGIGWACFGSLRLGLGVASTAGAVAAYVWLGGAIGLAGLTAGAAILAVPPKRPEE
jgi:hypothetical protein